MNKKKTLIILTPGFAADETDSTCLPPKQVFVKSLNKEFPLLNIIILPFNYPFITSTYKWNGNMVIPFNGNKKGKLSLFMFWVRIWRKLISLKKQYHIIGLFSFWCGECAFIGKWFGKTNGIKHLCWISGQDARKGNGYIPFIRPANNELVAMSDFLANEFYKNYAVRPEHIVPIGIDESMFENKIDEKDIDIIGAGSLIPLKQYDVFTGIIKVLSDNLPFIKSIICGKGPEEKKLKCMIEEMQLQKNIILMGETPHRQTLQLMQRSKILLHPSSYEGFGSVCIEALFAGCHVISFVQPMNKHIPQWHIVKTKKEMTDKALQLLMDTGIKYEKILAYSMDESAKAVMELFNYPGNKI